MVVRIPEPLRRFMCRLNVVGHRGWLAAIGAERMAAQEPFAVAAPARAPIQPPDRIVGSPAVIGACQVRVVGAVAARHEIRTARCKTRPKRSYGHPVNPAKVKVSFRPPNTRGPEWVTRCGPPAFCPAIHAAIAVAFRPQHRLPPACRVVLSSRTKAAMRVGRKPPMTIVAALVAVTAAQASTPASLPGQPCTPAALIGSWTIVEAKFGDQTAPTGPNQPVEYKHVTPTHFVVYQLAAGGTNTMTEAPAVPIRSHGGTYTELVQHGFGETFQNLGGQRLAFQCSIEGNDRWHISGKIGDVPLRETWKRVAADHEAIALRRGHLSKSDQRFWNRADAIEAVFVEHASNTRAPLWLLSVALPRN